MKRESGISPEIEQEMGEIILKGPISADLFNLEFIKLKPEKD
jgi:hypothetical protein